ncbi:WecB/TagA/CpsF family glycosyltransferase [Arthrobacter sp. MI7-26]|uniref:WecB/TagA/CpsF family glycosyltransferase n=1 Tax=Arthrobacter sp. MI7-26 TaxID=2993653 RepID=UPI002248E16C|nr:WecB/TagA/CpsF family glycosyltransferase [Arthrobacter sp. MI7-26]MCX2750283.1 WecB/TagA/CpsF family glycosyltransferase [Arthrobacter sp. MI7-26]
MPFDDAVRATIARATESRARPLGVISANLDHVHHFGQGGRWEGSLDSGTDVEWLTLVDGAPLRAQARRLTGRDWPRLAGSDLIGPLLDNAAVNGCRVGFLGGTTQTQEMLRNKLAKERPELLVVGWWSPDRQTLADATSSGNLADEVAEAGVDILVVGLGKPRQELWIAQHGARSGAKVLLAFGAVVDFLAGRVRRSPGWASQCGLEWAWRLALEPRRLARRYLVDGPEAYLWLRRRSQTIIKPKAGRFLPVEEKADVAVVVVTYNNAADIGPLIAGLRGETIGQTLKVIVADNSSSDGTLEELAKNPDVITVPTGGNLGYAGGINAALQHAGRAQSFLILNPDVRVEPGAVGALRSRMSTTGAGIVVPVLLDEDGSTYPSLRREPSIARAFGDALCGSRLRYRPAWLSEMDFDEESYLHPHRVEWATGAALLIRAQTAAVVGEWDERYFLYSEETDFFRRVRDNGDTIWFEPAARIRHRRGGSGSSPALNALMAVNRIRYAEKHHRGAYAATFRVVAAGAELIRLFKPDHREAVRAVLSRSRWERLPKATAGSEIGS